MSESREVTCKVDTQPLKELRGATFSVDLTTQGGIFYASPNNVQAVLDCIQQHHLTIDTLFGKGLLLDTHLQFSPQGFNKQKGSYEPLVHLLNTIVRISNKSLHTLTKMESFKAPPQCYLSRLHFCSRMKVISKYEGPLELHGLGLLGKPPKKAIPWEDVEVVIEVNNQIDVLVQQAAAYARCSLANNRRRSFTTVIGFNHRSLEVYFFVFHRSGLSSSGPLDLRTRQGFEGVVKHIVGMLSIQDEAGYGLDVTRSQKIFSINDRCYDLIRIHFMR